MNDLKGIPTHVSNIMVRVELAKAGIPAFDGAVICGRETVLTTVVGVMAFAGGMQVLFTRSCCHWSVDVVRALDSVQPRTLNERWCGTVPIGGTCGGADPTPKVVTSYHVDSQEALYGLVEVLREAFGDQCRFGMLDSRLVDMMPNKPEGLIQLSGLEDNGELARMHSAVLLAMGSLIGCFESAEHYLREAYRVAAGRIGFRSGEAVCVLAVLQRLYKTRIELLRERYLSWIAQNESVCEITYELTYVTMRLADVCRMLGNEQEVTQRIEAYGLEMAKGLSDTEQLKLRMSLQAP